MPIVVIGLSHHSSPVELRERFAFAESQVPEELGRLVDGNIATEGVILSTCNRVELYAYCEGSSREAVENVRQFLQGSRQCDLPAGGELYSFAEPHSVEHLFKVASGLDSMVLGETEILGQIKKAYQTALEHKFTGGKLNKAFQKAFNVAKHIRTHTNIQRGSVSVSSVGVELAEKIFSSLSERQVMVIGAGDTSEKAARALLSRGAKSIMVSNRSFDRAEALASELNGKAVQFDQWESEFEKIDIVISSTSAPHYVLDRVKLDPMMRARRNRPLLLIDLAVPRDIEPEVNFLDNVYLYNVDDLQAIAQDSMRQRKEEVVKCEEIIRDRAKGLLSTRAPREDAGDSSGLLLGQE